MPRVTRTALTESMACGPRRNPRPQYRKQVWNRGSSSPSYIIPFSFLFIYVYLRIYHSRT